MVFLYQNHTLLIFFVYFQMISVDRKHGVG
jgi:hypothetical protein